MANTRDTLGEQATLDGLVARTLTEFTEDGTNTLGERAFYHYTDLQRVCLPNIKTVPNYAFYETGLTQIGPQDFPNVTYISSYAFANCDNLESVEFTNASPIVFKSESFINDHKLTSVIIRSTTKSTLSRIDAFNGTPMVLKLGAVYVPDTLVETYLSDTKWNQLLIAPISSYPLTSFATITDTWEQILAAESDGSYLTKYKIGDTKKVKLGNYDVYLEIIAFDTDDLADDSGKAHITWLSKYIVYNAQMNTTNTNNGGWTSCKLRTDLRALLDASDADFKAAVKEVKKTYYSYSDSNTMTVNDTIWIPSAHEVNFSVTPIESEGVSYSQFNSDTARKKYNMSASTYYWWLRSARSNANGFRIVGSSGSAGYGSVNDSYGVVPGVCT